MSRQRDKERQGECPKFREGKEIKQLSTAVALGRMFWRRKRCRGTAVGPRDGRNPLVLRTVLCDMRAHSSKETHTSVFTAGGRPQKDAARGQACTRVSEQTGQRARSVHSRPGCGPKRSERGVQRKTRTRVFTAAPFTTAKSKNNSKLHQQLMWSGHTIGCHLAT